jgi:RsiW-degrading membrane proteinase PrsW (M82 family)
MIQVIWKILAVGIGISFLFIWGKDFIKSIKNHSRNGTFIRSYKLKETLYFILVITIPILFVNFSGLGGLFYHSSTFLFVSSVLIGFSISLVWYRFLNRVDHFEKEPRKTILLAFILGAAFTFLVFPITDFIHTNFNFYLNGELWNDWWYCVLSIGMVEELVKIIPVLILLKFTKQINEPFDYLFYGSISALGFAFIENVMYLNSTHLNAIYGRALFSSIAHMTFTSIITYGFVYFKYKKYDLKGFEFPFLLLVASTAHGFYDFWLINEKASSFNFITTIFYLVSIYFWATMINNALNISPFYNYSEPFKKARLKYRIVNLLISTIYFTYVAVFLLSDKSEANNLLVNSWEINVFVLLFLAINLSNIELLKGYVGNVEIRKKLRVLLPSLSSHKNYTGDRVKLFVPDESKKRVGRESIRSMFPIRATLERRVSIRGDADCYVIKSDKPFNIRNLDSTYFILKLVSKDKKLLCDQPRPMLLYGIRTNINFKDGIIRDKDILFLQKLYGIEIK